MPTPATADPATDKPPRRRRRIPLSLRIFVGMLALFGVGSLLSIGIPAYRQQVALHEIMRLAPGVETRPAGPRWLKYMIGAEWLEPLDDVIEVNLSYSEATDATLGHLGSLTGLETLLLTNTRVSDAGLSHLRGLTGLKVLYLPNTKVTDNGLEHLAGLTNLKMLSVEKTRVTDAGVARLKSALPGVQIVK
jgi:hypothetical protein